MCQFQYDISSSSFFSRYLSKIFETFVINFVCFVLFDAKFSEKDEMKPKHCVENWPIGHFFIVFLVNASRLGRTFLQSLGLIMNSFLNWLKQVRSGYETSKYEKQGESDCFDHLISENALELAIFTAR